MQRSLVRRKEAQLKGARLEVCTPRGFWQGLQLAPSGQLRASQFAVSCSGDVAPAITLVTEGWESSQGCLCKAP
jgi:hypothetical protein